MKNQKVLITDPYGVLLKAQARKWLRALTFAIDGWVCEARAQESANEQKSSKEIFQSDPSRLNFRLNLNEDKKFHLGVIHKRHHANLEKFWHTPCRHLHAFIANALLSPSQNPRQPFTLRPWRYLLTTPNPVRKSTNKCASNIPNFQSTSIIQTFLNWSYSLIWRVLDFGKPNSQFCCLIP